jgi:hypothetical protein
MSMRGMLRGDAAIARFVFEDERKRRLVKQLQIDGWPIFDLAGKRCAFPGHLTGARRKMLAGVSRRRRKAKQARTAAAVTTAI